MSHLDYLANSSLQHLINKPHEKTESGEQTAQRPSPGDAARAARRRRNGEGNKGSFFDWASIFWNEGRRMSVITIRLHLDFKHELKINKKILKKQTSCLW